MSKLLKVVILLAFLGGGLWYDHQRQKQRSSLSGFFETQPTQIASRVQGRVSRIAVAEGDTVKESQVLVELEAGPEVRDAQAGLNTAEQIRQQFLETQKGPRPEDIRRQEGVVLEMQANLEKLRKGNRPVEIEQARAAERNARARYDQARRGLTGEERAELKARLESAHSEERVTRADAERYQTLYKNSAVSQQLLERKQADAEKAVAQRRDAEETYLRATRGTPTEELEQSRQSWLQSQANLRLMQEGSRKEDVEAAEGRLLQSQAQLEALRNGNTREQVAQRKAAALAASATSKSLEDRSRDRILRAPRSGVVERIPVSLGDLVSSGTTLVRLTNPDDIWLRVYVPEDHLAQASVRASAELRIDGVADLLQAHVESISSQAEFKPANLQSPEERAKQVYGVKLRLDKPDPRVKAGMFANVLRIGEWRQ